MDKCNNCEERFKCFTNLKKAKECLGMAPIGACSICKYKPSFNWYDSTVYCTHSKYLVTEYSHCHMFKVDKSNELEIKTMINRMRNNMENKRYRGRKVYCTKVDNEQQI